MAKFKRRLFGTMRTAMTILRNCAQNEPYHNLQYLFEKNFAIFKHRYCIIAPVYCIIGPDWHIAYGSLNSLQVALDKSVC